MTAGALSTKGALVTGASIRPGIGFAIAEALAAAGADVVVSGRREPDADALAALQAHGATAIYHAADLTKPDEIARLVARAEAALGGIDILVNNAGTNHPNLIEDIPPADWDEVIAVNLSAAYHAIRLVLPGMKARGWGRIVNVASALGLIGYPTVAAYTASKHGLVGLTKAVALETAETAITCNAICPGYTDTALLRRVIDETAGLWGVTADAARRRMIAADHPSKAMVEPEALGALAVFLAGEAGAQIRGAALPVDGGWTAR